MNEPFTPSFFRSLQQLKIRTRKTVLGSRQGSHRSARRGHGLEFADYRVYSPGDDFRHIDWGVLGRTDRLYVREFREERDLNVLILLDCSGSMASPQSSKYTFAKNLALALGFIGLADGDSLRIAALGQGLSPRYVGPRALPKAYNFLSSFTPSGAIDLAEQVRTALASGKLPGKCFFISDFLGDAGQIFEACDLIRGKNYDLSLLQVLSPEELAPDFRRDISVLEDAETGELFELELAQDHSLDYAKILASHISSLEQYAVHAGIIHALISSGDSLADTVLTRLPELKLLQ